MKTALITGVNGQDGSYLSELLLDKGYTVYGMVRRSSVDTTERIAALHNAERFTMLHGDITDSLNVMRIIGDIQPDEIYNLAAQSHVAVSFELPEYTADADGTGTLRILESVRLAGLAKKTRIYQASTSELFGKVEETPQRETTPFHPRSPYAVAKLYAYWMARHYREAYGVFASNGILFNHESERRGETFVTRKITLAAARIAHGLQDTLYLGNMNAQRDWGYAPDYVDCMWRILQHDEPDDFVIATGETRTVREFASLAFQHAGIPIIWKGEGIDEHAVHAETGKTVIAVDPKFFRPADVEMLLGDPSKVKTILGWNPRLTTFEELVEKMVSNDMRKIALEASRS